MINLADSLRRQQQNTGLRNLFTGTVVDNNDPERRQRVKVRIPDVHRGIGDADLPWARKKDGSGAAAGVGEVRVPPVGAKVSVEFRNGDQYQPEYGGTPVSDDVGVEDSFPNYPNSYGWVDQAGNSVIIDTTDGSNSITITHCSGTVIQIDNTGKIKLSAADNILMEGQGDIAFKCNGKFSVDAGAGIALKGNGASIGMEGSMDIRGSNVQVQGGSVHLKGNVQATNDPTVTGASPAGPQSPSAPNSITPGTRPVIPSPAGQTDA